MIYFAGSVQYFENLPKVINRRGQFLTDDGERHMLDRLFYQVPGHVNAKARTVEYYKDFWVPENGRSLFSSYVRIFENFELQGFVQTFPLAEVDTS